MELQRKSHLSVPTHGVHCTVVPGNGCVGKRAQQCHAKASSPYNCTQAQRFQRTCSVLPARVHSLVCNSNRLYKQRPLKSGNTSPYYTWYIVLACMGLSVLSSAGSSISPLHHTPQAHRAIINLVLQSVTGAVRTVELYSNCCNKQPSC